MRTESTDDESEGVTSDRPRGQVPKSSLESILETFMIGQAKINNNVNHSLMLQKVHMEALD